MSIINVSVNRDELQQVRDNVNSFVNQVKEDPHYQVVMNDLKTTLDIGKECIATGKAHIKTIKKEGLKIINFMHTFSVGFYHKHK